MRLHPLALVLFVAVLGATAVADEPVVEVAWSCRVQCGGDSWAETPVTVKARWPALSPGESEMTRATQSSCDGGAVLGASCSLSGMPAFSLWWSSLKTSRTVVESEPIPQISQ